jgi:hypothetical protein
MAEDCKNIFFFENGNDCEATKITKKVCELEELIWKRSDGQFAYEEKK